MNAELEQPEKVKRLEDMHVRMQRYWSSLPQNTVILTIGKWVDGDYKCESVDITIEDADKLSALFGVKINDCHA